MGVFIKCAIMHTILFLAGLIAYHQVLAIPSPQETFTELSTTESTMKEALRRKISAHEAAISAHEASISAHEAGIFQLKSKLALVEGRTQDGNALQVDVSN